MIYDNGKNHDSSAYDHRDRGVLFKNEKKAPGSRQPDFRGTLNVGGTEFLLAGWTRESSRTGKRFLSLKVEGPEVSHRSTDRRDADNEL